MHRTKSPIEGFQCQAVEQDGESASRETTTHSNSESGSTLGELPNFSRGMHHTAHADRKSKGTGQIHRGRGHYDVYTCVPGAKASGKDGSLSRVSKSCPEKARMSSRATPVCPNCGTKRELLMHGIHRSTCQGCGRWIGQVED